MGASEPPDVHPRKPTGERAPRTLATLIPTKIEIGEKGAKQTFRQWNAVFAFRYFAKFSGKAPTPTANISRSRPLEYKQKKPIITACYSGGRPEDRDSNLFVPKGNNAEPWETFFWQGVEKPPLPSVRRTPDSSEERAGVRAI